MATKVQKNSPRQPQKTEHRGRARKQDSVTNKKKRQEWLTIAGLLLVTFIVFFPSLFNDFVNWDDFNYVRDNPIIQDLSSKNISHIFNTSTYVMGNYHPFTVMSYCFEYALFKLNPLYYHLDNILIHLLNIVLVYVFIKMLLSDLTRAALNPGLQPTAAITATLFAFHPLRVESVTWVAERKDVLYTLFFLLSLISYLQYLRKTQTKFYIASIVFFLFSILSKGQAVVLAPILLLIDYFLKRKIDQKALLEKIPFFVLALLFGIVAMKAQHTSLTTERLASHSPLERLLIASYGMLMYLVKFVLPLKLSCFYQYPDKIDGFYYVAPAVVIALLVALFVFGRSRREIIFGSLFFLIAIAIVLQLLPVGDAVIAERYTYIPYIGLFFLVSSFIAKLLEKSNVKNIVKPAGIIVLIGFLILTFNQTKAWKNSITLWTSVIKYYPTTSVAYNNRGQSYFDNKQYELAFDDFNQALKYNPNYAYAFKNRGAVYQNLKKFDLAVIDYKKAISISPNFSSAMFNLGLNYVDAGKPDSALYYYDMAIQYEPDNPQHYYSKGIAFKALGKIKESMENYDKALQLNPRYTEAYDNRGNLFFNMGQYDRAIEDYNKSIGMDPKNARAYSNRSMAYYSKKDFRSALADAKQAEALGNAMDSRYLEMLKAGQ